METDRRQINRKASGQQTDGQINRHSGQQTEGQINRMGSGHLQ